jgi:hypothetical protein
MIAESVPGAAIHLETEVMAKRPGPAPEHQTCTFQVLGVD